MEQSMASTPFGNALQLALRAKPVATGDHRFIALLNGYRSNGGLQRLTTLQAARRQAWNAELIDRMPLDVAERRILGIDWNREVWIPDFQFQTDGAIHPTATAVFLELKSSLDAWGLASWFLTPSPWLQDDRPIDLLEFASSRVVEAARVDRYVASGG